MAEFIPSNDRFCLPTRYLPRVLLSRAATWRTVTIIFVLAVLTITFLGLNAQDDVTRGVYPAIAGRSAIYFVAAFGIPALLAPLVLRINRATPWITGAVGLVVVLVPMVLWVTSRDGLAFQWTQSFKFGSTDLFGDLRTPLEWMDCARRGIDPYADSVNECTGSAMNYGPGLVWFSGLGVLVSAIGVLGIVGVLVSVASIVWLSRHSDGRGKIVLLFAVIAPAWIDLMVLANLDQAIVWLAVFLVIIVRRMGPHRLLPWVLAAIPIWLVGTWKYYPFAMLIAFIPVLRIRRGWMLIAAFVVATGAYLLAYWPTILTTMGSQAGWSGGVGRDTLAAFIGGQETVDRAVGWSDLLVVLLMLAAFAWGWASKRAGSMDLTPGRVSSAMLAAAGSAALISSVTVSGFGWPYKAAILVLVVPLLADASTSPIAFWRSTSTMLILVVLAMTVVWNPLVGSLAVHLVASFALGFAVHILITAWRTSSNVPAEV